MVFWPDAAVWVVRRAGSSSGRVGDFGLGLTNPPGETVDGVFLSVVGFPAVAGGVVDRFDWSWGLPTGFGCDEGVVVAVDLIAFALEAAPFRGVAKAASVTAGPRPALPPGRPFSDPPSRAISLPSFADGAVTSTA